MSSGYKRSYDDPSTSIHPKRRQTTSQVESDSANDDQPQIISLPNPQIHIVERHRSQALSELFRVYQSGIHRVESSYEATLEAIGRNNLQSSKLGGLPAEIRILIYDKVLRPQLIHIRMYGKSPSRVTWKLCRNQSQGHQMLCASNNSCGQRSLLHVRDTNPILFTCRLLYQELKKEIFKHAIFQVDTRSIPLFSQHLKNISFQHLTNITITGKLIASRNESGFILGTASPRISFDESVITKQFPRISNIAIQMESTMGTRDTQVLCRTTAENVRVAVVELQRVKNHELIEYIRIDKKSKMTWQRL